LGFSSFELSAQVRNTVAYPLLDFIVEGAGELVDRRRHAVVPFNHTFNQQFETLRRGTSHGASNLRSVDLKPRSKAFDMRPPR